VNKNKIDTAYKDTYPRRMGKNPGQDRNNGVRLKLVGTDLLCGDRSFSDLDRSLYH
jgi:hypothetical protein